MKGSLLTIIVALTAFIGSAHDYYFSFAEMEYNPVTQKIEMTLTVTTHDFERALEMGGDELDNIASPTDEEVDLITKHINRHLKLITGENKSFFNFVGHEVSLNGTTNFYFESDLIEIKENFEITYDLLMHTYEQQQNKVTFYYEGQAHTAAFTRLNQTQTILIEN